MLTAFVRALCFLLATVLDAAGVALTLTTVAQQPGSGYNLGTTAVGSNYNVVSITTGTGPTLVTHFTGYWHKV
jgi:hypothetical protein